MKRVVLYAFLGVLVDFLISLYYAQMILWKLTHNPFYLLSAAVLGIVITVTTFIIFYKIAVKWNLKLIIAYAVGTGAGTVIGMII